MRRRGNYYRRRGKRRGPGIWTGNFLKMIAVIAMVMDHFAVAVMEQGILAVCNGDPDTIKLFFDSEMGARFLLADRILRGTGRIAFPIICFLLTEGFFHTRNRKRYLLRLSICAVGSEVFFDLAVYDSWIYMGYQNAVFTLVIALAVLMGMRRFRRKPAMQLLCVLAGSGISWLIRSDYCVIGIILPAVFYWFSNEPIFQLIIGSILSLTESIRFFGSAVLAYIPVMLYNGKRGYWNLKYFFYAFFPVQFLMLYLLRKALLYGDWFSSLILQAIQ